MFSPRPGLLALTTIALLLLPAAPAVAEDGHPYLLWTPDEAADLRETIENEPWARRAFENLPPVGDDAVLANLLRYTVMGDRSAGEHEKERLLAGKGNPIDQALRYDCLYGLLAPAERQRVEKRFRSAVRGAMETLREQRWMNRYNILPNLTYFWIWDHHMLPLAMRDEELAKEFFEAPMSMKWYVDDYLTDAGFYNEEFSKMFVRAGAQLLWCRGCDRLGIPELGWDYVGEDGATWRGHVESVIDIGFPRVDLGTERYHYPRMTMGDARGSRGIPAYGFQHNLVPGWLTDRPAAKMSEYHGGHLPQWVWFEIAHEKYPDAGFDYFLAQRQPAGEDTYYPTLYFGLEPIEAADADPPSAASDVYPERGLVMLRAEHGRDYWTSDAPAVGMRLATPYAHHVQDCFALLGFYAFNRPIFVNHAHATNYTGVDPAYSNSSRSHSTVMVDFAEPKTIGQVATRHDFGRLMKFAAERGYGIYDGVTQTRALMLTREYLLDAFHLASDRPRHYQWLIQTFGHACPDQPRAWTPTRDLVGSLFDVARERSLETDGTWSVTAVQSSGGASRRFSGFGDRWFEQRIGVRTTVLGEGGTTAYHAWAPVVNDSPGHWTGRDRFAYGEDEPAGVTIAAVRKKPETTFIAVHEPFRDSRRTASVRRVARGEDAFVVRVEALAREDSPGESGAFTDYLMLRFGEDAEAPVTLGDASERFSFAGHGFVRVADGRVDVEGGVREFCVPVNGDGVELSIDGEPADGRIRDGFLCYPVDVRPPEGPVPARGVEAERSAGPIAARWLHRQALCLPVGGRGSAVLRLRNEGLAAVDATVELRGPEGLRISPARVELAGFPSGAERDVEVTVSAADARRNALLRVEPGVGDGDVHVQRAVLKVANGVCVEHDQRMRGEPVKIIYAPRYVAKYRYMESGCASLLLDPNGYRRSGAGWTSYPNLVQPGTDSRGREGWHHRTARKFPYFIPVVVPGEEGEPPLVYEGGWHPHGTTSAMEHWFTEDWIVCRYREGDAEGWIAFDWNPPQRKASLREAIIGRRADLMAERAPGKALAAGRDGSVHDATRLDRRRHRVKVDVPREVEYVTALFVRPHGYQYGRATFYPPESRWDGDRVTQPAGAPMGFTFCREEDFSALVEKWLADPPDAEPRPVEKSTYEGAFMPHKSRPK
ncbi:MAG: hypothetical protein ACLFVW_04685 [Phycisphaerae bacterium]